MLKVAPDTQWRPKDGRQKNALRKSQGISAKYFPAATYSSTPQGCSTIGPEGLSCRVRNGIGRFPPGITTGKKLQPKPSNVKNANVKINNKNNCVIKPHDRLVRVSSTRCHASTSRLSTRWSTWGLQGHTPGRPYLGVGFPLRCFQRLSFPSIATQLCHWRDNWCTRGSSIPVLSY